MAPATDATNKGQDFKNKIVAFGRIKHASAQEEAEKYEYYHLRPTTLEPSRGHIPVGYLARISLDENSPLFLATRDGGFDDRADPIGPEYQITWKKERMIIGAGDGWNRSLDDAWATVLAHFDRKNLFPEEILAALDRDPFILFGIDERVTQQALAKLEQFPALMCQGDLPSIEEWREYLRIDLSQKDLQWLVHAFAETELPKPWTCYKGIGSIVCYIRSDTGQVTWKHPFYDYFAQLKQFCEQATHEEIVKVRVNRLLWSYEASRVETEHDLEPLVSPEYIQRLGDIFGYDIKQQGFLVRNLKAQIKVFATTYREKQDIDLDDVIHCSKVLKLDCAKHVEMCKTWESESAQQVSFELDELSNGQVVCVNCEEAVALCFCLECKDYLCLECFAALHGKGARRDHAPFRLVPCALCSDMPAKLHCTFTDKSLCHECYAMKHIKVLPPDGKENQPRRIDYKQQYARYAKFAKERQETAEKVRKRDLKLALTNQSSADSGDDQFQSVLSTDWHPFYDVRGVKYYHNFKTGERMRQSPRRVPNTADPGAEVDTLEGIPEGTMDPAGSTFAGTARTGTGFLGMAETGPLSLRGYESLRTEPSATKMAHTLPDSRSPRLRAPFRTHMPRNGEVE